MDKRIGILFKIFGVIVLILIIYIYGYFVIYPHYFFKVNDYGLMNSMFIYQRVQTGIPELVCDGSIDYNRYDDVFRVKIYWKECVMYNLPDDEIYLKEQNKFIYYSIKYQGIYYIIFIIMYILKEIYDQKTGKETFIYKLQQESHRG